MNLLQAAQPRTWRGFLYGVVLGAVVMAVVALWAAIAYWPRPGPAKVTVNPTKKEEHKADLVVKQDGRGKIHGFIPRPGAGDQVATDEPAPKPSGEASTDQEQHSPAAGGGETNPLPQEGGRSADQPPVGQTVTFPVAGQVDLTYTDARTGRELGRGTVPVTGEGLATWYADGVDLSAELRLTGRFAVWMPEEPDRLNHLGVYWEGQWSAYYRRDWRLFCLGPVELLAYGQAEVDQAGQVTGRVGAELRF